MKGSSVKDYHCNSDSEEVWGGAGHADPKRPQHLHLHLGHTGWSFSQRLTITATITITVTTTVTTTVTITITAGGPPFSHPSSTRAGPTRAMGV